MTTSYSTLYQSLIQAFKKAHLNKSTWTLIASVLACVPAVAAENELASQENTPVADFPKMTVTATRTPTAVNNTIAQTRVIDSEDLKRYQGQTVLDVIKHQPGINFTQNGGLGTTSNFYLRGYDSKQVLILIDGMRYGSATTGQPALNLLPIEQIERIEVLHGASGSSIYGSDAMGGVIQVFTKGQNVKQNQLSVTAGIGSNNHYLYGASAQMSNDKGTSLSISASRNETDGFNAVKSGDNYHSDDDGFESKSASLALHQRFNQNLTAGITALYSDSTTDIDGFPASDWQTGEILAPAVQNAYADQKNGAANAYVQYDTGKNNTKLSYGYSIDESTTYDDAYNPSQGSVFDTKQQTVRLENTANVAALANLSENLGQLIYGAEYLKQSVDSTQTYLDDDRTIKSGFVGYNYAGKKFSAQGNFRLDDNSQYGKNHAYNIGGAIKTTDKVTVGANYAKSFRAPNFNELYWPGSGNANLRPETSDNYELFTSFDTDNQSTRLTAFYNEVEDLIAWSDKSNSNNNVNEAQIVGATLTSDWQLYSWLMGMSYTYQEAKDKGGDFTDGNLLAYRPKNLATAYVGYQLPKLDVRLEAQYVDDRYTSTANTAKLDSYTLVNLSGNYQITPELTGSVRVENITDEDYSLSNQFGTEYATDGTSYFGSLTYTWK